MTGKVLNKSQIEQFIELGWVKLDEAFPREAALAAQDYLWNKLEDRGVRKQDRATWTQPLIRINENYSTEEFQRCNTPRLADGIEDLVGAGRLVNRSVYRETEFQAAYGWWPVNFALDADKPWDVPVKGWHWDGIHFRHAVDSPDQGLLCLCLFSEVGHRGGGTLIAEGSHKVVARLLSRHPGGLEHKDAIALANRSHPWLAELTGTSAPDSLPLHNGLKAGDERGSDTAGSRIETFMKRWYTDEDGVQLRVLETIGSPGDVFLCHPFLYHASSQNHAGVPRFMCNRTTPLQERLQLRRDGSSEYSPLELSIRKAGIYS